MNCIILLLLLSCCSGWGNSCCGECGSARGSSDGRIAGRGNSERREPDRRDADRREPDRRDADRREPDRRNSGRRDSDDCGCREERAVREGNNDCGCAQNERESRETSGMIPPPWQEYPGFPHRDGRKDGDNCES